ncbi:MAG: glycosyltransferase [Anaerolineae bacterium]|jgi:UDP:flavonoid glycosyltransferase YjiC (YdhE family)|nr:glycosyltransferase [Anaerolineae bacterium]
MRITILATGSRGDVEPYVALGKGFLAAGHAVRLVTHEDFESLVASNGIEYWRVEGRVQEIAEGMAGLLEEGNFRAIMAEMGRQAKTGALRLADAGVEACRGADRIVGGIAGIYTGTAIAEKLDIPFTQAYYIPYTPTRAYPSFALPKTPLSIGPVNKLSYTLARQVMWQPIRAADTRVRREKLGLPPAPMSGPFNSPVLRGEPVLYGFSPVVIPRASDWGANVHVTGYWFLNRHEEWTPPPALSDFLLAGSPPVYVGFGSMSNQKPRETAQLVIDALTRAGQRGVILGGWGGLAAGDLPRSIFALESAPFGWLFPRMAAVAHHGGAGTTAAGLAAGVPGIVIPFFGDQPFWGARVQALGAGPAPIPRKKLTVERLAAAIEQAVSDGGMRSRAAEIGAKIRAEDGVRTAVEAAERSWAARG